MKLSKYHFPQYLYQVYSFATIISLKLHICTQILIESLLVYFRLNEVTSKYQFKVHTD
ncbi:hypothetical protein OIU84_024694 [Salix udensis]|uniref:Uncharacterized protein n=1 Tax=Salix udensis TaxID=889485 RepID=A0AAD6KID2_9ROSI|nr:hypothetical protein OIU84_024694 [Salix udensis]